MVHAFADCELDEELFQLRRRGKVVKIEPKVFDVLAYLLRHRDRVVSKDELLDAVWSRQAVSESVLPKCVAAARQAVGDGRTKRKIIETVHGRGYRFVAAVRDAAPRAVESTALAAAPVPRTPFVGREDAMQRLRAGLEAAAAGHGHVFLLVGEPGIGKTRTAETFAGEAAAQHASVLVGRAHEAEGAPAFWPWMQILRSCMETSAANVLAADPRHLVADLAAIVPELTAKVANVVPTTIEGPHARFRLFDSVTTFLKRASGSQPLVLVLDDVHWADEASLQLLRFLATEVADARIVVIATYREIEVRRGHPLAAVLGALARESNCERLVLRGLTRADTHALIAAIGEHPPAEWLTDAVHEMTEGNPFFIQEIVHWLKSGGMLQRLTPERQLRLALPQSVRDAVGRRLSGLSPSCNHLLRLASVLGREFSASWLARVAELPQEAVFENLAEAVSAGVVDEDGDAVGRYTFHHALIRQTLYEELSTPERVRLHGRAGTALEELCGANTDPYLDQLAHHFFQAAAGGAVEKAVALCVRAAERALQVLAYEQSARHYESALQAFELHVPRDEARRCELLLGLGDAQQAAGARDAARNAFERAAEIARRLARTDLLARAALGYRGPAEMGMPPESTTLALLEEAVAAVGNAHPVLRARLLSRLVGTPPYANSMERRAELSREALDLARAGGDPTALRDALSARLWACMGPDHIDERLRVARELLELANQQRSSHAALLAYDAQLGACLLRGDLQGADRALEGFTRAAEELRQPTFRFHATFAQGSRALARGELDRAEALFRQALDRGRNTVPYAHFMFAGQMYNIVYLRGAGDDAELQRIFFGEMMELPYSWEPAMHSALAFSLLLRGERDAARQEFETVAAPGLGALRRDEHWLVTLGSLSSVAVLLEDRPRAAVLYELLRPYADLVLVHDLLRSTHATVHTVLGALATLLGRFDVGADHFERALAKQTEIGARLALIESRTGYARLLTLRQQPGDRARADQLLADARAEMAALGVRQNWQLTALELLLAGTSAENRQQF